jgi:hypothetical protein
MKSPVPPEGLARVVDQSALARRIFGDYPFQDSSFAIRTVPWGEGGWLTRERRRRSALIVRLAAELYRREKGQPPGDGRSPARHLAQGVTRGDRGGGHDPEGR